MGLPIVNLSLIPTFPAKVFGDGPITVDKSGLNYTIGFDGSVISENPAPDENSSSIAYNKATGALELVDFSDFPVALDAVTGLEAALDGKASLSLVNLQPEMPPFNATANDGITDESAKLIALFQAAKDANLPVRLDRTYVASLNIPWFHDVKKIGAGVVIAGSSAFYPEPGYAQSTNIYISTSGDDANDGLTAARPIQTVDRAVAILTGAQRGNGVGGLWNFYLAAGTYTFATTAALPELNSRGFVTFVGPAKGHPLVPTAIISGGGSLANLFTYNRDSKYRWVDIKFTGWTANAIVGGFGPENYCENIHGDGGGVGTTVIRNTLPGAKTLIKGGIYKNCTGPALESVTATSLTAGYNAAQYAPVTTLTMTSGAGQTSGTLASASGITVGMYVVGVGIPDDTRVSTLVGTTVTLDKATTAAWVSGAYIGFLSVNSGPAIFNNDTGIYVAEHSMLHCDYSAVFANITNIRLLRSRMNNTHSQIKGGTYGVDNWDGQWVPIGAGADVDGNTVNESNRPGGNLATQGTGTNGRAVSSAYRLIYVYTPTAAHTGTTAQTNVATVWTVPRRWFTDPTKKMVLRGAMTLNAGGAATAGTVTLFVKFGASNVVGIGIPAAAAAGSEVLFEASIIALTNASQRAWISGGQSGAAPRSDAANTAISFASADQALTVALTLGSAADSVTLDHYELYVEGA